MAKKIVKKETVSKGIEVIPESVEIGAVNEVVDASGMTMQMPGLDDAQEGDHDKVHSKEHEVTVINRQFRAGGRRTVMLDALARALNCRSFLGNVDKPWGQNPLGADRQKISVRYSREFPEKNILMDIFPIDDDKTQKLITYKKRLAHEHGYYYLVQTPASIFTHDELTKQVKAEEESKKKEGW